MQNIIFADIFIGFQLPSTTYPEKEQTHSVTIIKGTGNVTEQAIVARVSLWEKDPSDSGFDVATPSKKNNDNDLAFGDNDNYVLVTIPPNVNEVIVPVYIYDDKLPENTEAAQLTLEIPALDSRGNSPPWFEILPNHLTFTIVISDNDRKLCVYVYLLYIIIMYIGEIFLCCSFCTQDIVLAL